MISDDYRKEMIARDIVRSSASFVFRRGSGEKKVARRETSGLSGHGPARWRSAQKSPRTFSARIELTKDDPDVSRLATFSSPLPRRRWVYPRSFPA